MFSAKLISKIDYIKYNIYKYILSKIIEFVFKQRDTLCK